MFIIIIINERLQIPRVRGWHAPRRAPQTSQHSTAHSTRARRTTHSTHATRRHANAPLCRAPQNGAAAGLCRQSPLNWPLETPAPFSPRRQAACSRHHRCRGAPSPLAYETQTPRARGVAARTAARARSSPAAARRPARGVRVFRGAAFVLGARAPPAAAARPRRVALSRCIARLVWSATARPSGRRGPRRHGTPMRRNRLTRRRAACEASRSDQPLAPNFKPSPKFKPSSHGRRPAVPRPVAARRAPRAAVVVRAASRPTPA